MNTKYRIPLILALVAIPVVAMAHPGKGKMAAFDKDANGSLDATERAAMIAARKDEMAARHAEMLAKFDTNKDGTLDDTERAAKKQAMIDLEFARLDVNQDGSISKLELAQGMRDFGGHGGRGGHHRGGPRGGDSK